MADDKAEETVKAVEEPQAAEPEASTLTPDNTETPDKEAFIAMRREIKELKDQLKTRDVYPPTPQTTVPSYDYYQDPQVAAQQGQANDDYANYVAQVEAMKVAEPRLDDTSDQYDPELETEIASKFYFEKNVQGKNVSFREVAQRVLQKNKAVAKKAEAEIAAEADKAVSEKEIAASPTGARTANAATVEQRVSDAEEEELLSWKSRGALPQSDRFGNRVKVSLDEQNRAIAERLKKIPSTESS